MLRFKVFKTTSVTHKLGFRFPVIIMIKHLKKEKNGNITEH